MSARDRNRLRKLQDKLLAICGDRFPEHFRISADFPGSPTIGDLRKYVFVAWEPVIKQAIKVLS